MPLTCPRFTYVVPLDMSDAISSFQSCAQNKAYYSEQLVDELNNASSSWSEGVNSATSDNEISQTLDEPLTKIGQMRTDFNNSSSYRTIVSSCFCAIFVIVVNCFCANAQYPPSP